MSESLALEAAARVRYVWTDRATDESCIYVFWERESIEC